ncbi:CopG family ribbon-helix-helix protein [Ferrovibrio sp.]|uniref:CopG family ribbon-helix-helix protein n=1 Tax=Ferrovibrio sp. TaxID=1917215 RepID=UPI0025BAB430|nr:CopG family ribbon-helix-helix protein [Ferrovibrio sp.]MBX3454721.1 CopG family ribbon-helix-helix protein [Ferrovibrio sp.]
MSVSVKLDSAEQLRLRNLAEQRDRTPHYLMREAIRQYLDREEARESFKREALAAWQSFQETGEHITGAALGSWLDRWGTAAESTPPKWQK